MVEVTQADRDAAADLNEADAAWNTRPEPAPFTGLEARAREVRLVAGPVWQDDERDENDNAIWTAEVQAFGGYGVIATVYAGSEVEAGARQRAILSVLNAEADTDRVAAAVEAETERCCKHLRSYARKLRTEEGRRDAQWHKLDADMVAAAMDKQAAAIRQSAPKREGGTA